MFKSIPKVALIVPALALGLMGLMLYTNRTTMNYSDGRVWKTNNGQSIILPKNIKFELGKKPLTQLQKLAKEKLACSGNPVVKGTKTKPPKASLVAWITNLFEPRDADATSFPGAGVTATNTPGANINLQLATPQSSAAYVACNMAISPVCRVYVNAAISTFAIYNGVDGTDYVVELVQDGTGHSVAVPTAGGTPAGISTQVAGWSVAQAPIAAAVSAVTQQAGSITTWKMIYDSSAQSFIVYSIN